RHYTCRVPRCRRSTPAAAASLSLRMKWVIEAVDEVASVAENRSMAQTVWKLGLCLILAAVVGSGAPAAFSAESDVSEEAGSATAVEAVETVDPAAPVAELLTDVLPTGQPWLVTGVALGAVIVLALIAHLIVRGVVLVVMDRLIRRTRTSWD